MAAAIVIATLIINGPGLAARAATALVMPVGLLWLLFFMLATWNAFSRNRSAAILFLGCWLLIGLVFNYWISRAYISLVEHRPADELPASDLPLRAVVVLGGGAAINGYGIDELGRDGERVVSAAQLWHAGQTRSIICTGGTGDPVHDASAVGRRLLKSVGVPENAIITIIGENTSQEMLQLEQLLASPPSNLPNEGKLGLITSAFHMHRALRLAKGRSLDFVPLPCAYRSSSSPEFSPRDLVPTAGHGSIFGSALKEQLARLAGR